MNSKISSWLNAFRLRTLPLAFSSIIAGSFAACKHGFDRQTFALALITTLLLQVLSNLSNDFGDSEKGTDNDLRIGPKRAVQAGLLTFSEIRKGIFITAVLAFVSGLFLVIHALGEQLQTLFFIALGISAIAAAIKYTVGKNAYGYSGFGDLFVLLFFGIVGVCGSFYLQQKNITLPVFWLSIAVGCFATMVLNLNNMRDRESDKISGKNTLVVKIGAAWAKRYHTLLLGAGIISSFAYLFETSTSWAAYLPVFTYPLFLFFNAKIQQIDNPKDFDSFLPKTAMTTFLFALLFAVGQGISCL